MIQRFSALALVVLIALPFTAPFAAVDLRNAHDSPASRICDAISAPVTIDAQDDAPAWLERSARYHSVAVTAVTIAWPPCVVVASSAHHLSASRSISPHPSARMGNLRV